MLNECPRVIPAGRAATKGVADELRHAQVEGLMAKTSIEWTEAPDAQ